MEFLDITRTLQEAPVYPGSSPAMVQRVSDMQDGAAYRCSMIVADSHAGTHADAYCHFLMDSDVSIDQMELSHYYGPCRVVSVQEKAPIQKEALVGKIEGATRLVLHGGGESYLTRDAAKYLVSCGISTLVTDAWSVAPLDNETEIHTILLRAGVAIVENALLDHVPDGRYTLSAFPIKLGGCDGAPVRAVLIRE